MESIEQNHFDSFSEMFDYLLQKLPIPEKSGPKTLLVHAYLSDRPETFKFEKVQTSLGYFWVFEQCLFKGGGLDLPTDTLQYYECEDIVCERYSDDRYVSFKRNELDILERHINVIEHPRLKVIEVIRKYDRYYYKVVPITNTGYGVTAKVLHQSKLRIYEIPTVKFTFKQKLRNILHGKIKISLGKAL